MGAVTAAVTVASAMYQGISSSEAAHRNAKLSRYYSEYNAANNAASNAYNASVVKATSMFNAFSAMAQAKANAGIALKLGEYDANLQKTFADYNASLVEQVSKYNSLLTEQEAYQTWDEANLDVFRLKQEFNKVKGSMIAHYGASGVQINHTDTPAIALADARTQNMLNTFIVRHGADIKAAKLLNAAAQSRTEGIMEANKIRFEGYSKAAGTLFNAQSRAQTNLLSGQFSALGSLFQGAIGVNKLNMQTKLDTPAIEYRGAADAYRFDQKGDQALIGGFVQAAKYGVSAYSKLSTPSPGSPGGGVGGASRVSDQSLLLESKY